MPSKPSLATTLKSSQSAPDKFACDAVTELCLRAYVVFFAAASLAYWVVLATRLPIITWYVFFAAISLLLIRVLRNGSMPKLSLGDPDTLVLLLAGIGAAAINLFTRRPDADDFNFLRNGAVASSDLLAPVSLYNTGFDLNDLPSLSPAHLITSYDVVIGLVAKLLFLPAVPFAHFVVGSAMAFLVPIVAFALLRQINFRPRPALFGSVAVVVFLAASGDTHRDWGNFTLLRMWQGKCVFVAVQIPLLWAATISWMQDGTKRAFLSLAMVVVSGIGMTGSALFLIPWVVTSAVGGYIVASKLDRESWTRSFLAVPSVSLTCGLVALLGVYLTTPPKQVSAWVDGWPADAFSSLSLVTPAHQQALSGLLIVLMFVFAGKSRLVSAITFGTFGSLVFLLAPWTSDLLFTIVTPAAFWRFFYGIPVPIFFGIISASLLQMDLSIIGRDRLMVAARFNTLIFLSIVLLIKNTSLQPDLFALPVAPKLELKNFIIASQMSQDIDTGATILAPTKIVIPLGLIRPDLRFISTRGNETIHVFGNSDRLEEGEFRRDLQRLVTSCRKMASKNQMEMPLNVDVVVIDGSCAEGLRITGNLFESASFFDLDGNPIN